MLLNIKCLTLISLNFIVTMDLCDSSNILVVLPTSTKSHFNIFKPIVQILATEHNVTFYNIHNTRIIHQNITQKRVISEYLLSKKLSMFKEIWKEQPYNQILSVLQYFSAEHFEVILKGNDINTLINSTEKYDLLITLNVLAEPIFKLAHVLNTSLIQVATSIPFPWSNVALRTHNSLVNDNSFITDEIPNSYIQRVIKFMKQVYVWLYYEWIYLPELESKTSKYFPPGTPAIKEISHASAGMLVNYISAMGYSRSVSPNILEIGGLHCRRPEPLPVDIEKFISDSGDDGIIYMSLGSTVSDSVLTPDIKKSILNVFAKLPQKILFKMDKEIDNLPDNVKTSTWFPQQDILGHNKTRLFITQGGMLSLQEAAYHGVQVLVLPLICDQFANGYLTEQKGYGRVIRFNNISEENFYENIQDLINNPKYKINAKLISSSVVDQTSTLNEDFKRWINFIIRHKSLHPMTENHSIIQMLELDVYYTIFLVHIAFVIILIFILKITFRCFVQFCLRNFKLKEKKL